MLIRKKVLLILTMVFLIIGIIDLSIQKLVIFPSFLALEDEEADKDMKRTVQVIKNEISHLDSLAHDWAAWDDTYSFIAKSSKEYISSNLGANTFIDNHLNLIYFIDLQGNIEWGEIHDLEAEKKIAVKEISGDHLPATHPFFQFDFNKTNLSKLSINGIYSTDKGPLLIASRPILNSNNEGPPRGSVVMGRFLNDEMIAGFKDQIHTDFVIQQIQKTAISDTNSRILDNISPKKTILIEKSNDEYLNVYSTLSDINHNSIYLITVKIQRKIVSHGWAAMRYAIFVRMILVVSVLVLIVVILQIVILNPTIQLTKFVLSVKKPADLLHKGFVTRKDELGTLSREFNRMFERLQKSEDQYKHFIEKAPVGIFTISKNGNLIYTNRYMQKVSGYTAKDFKGKSLFSKIHPLDLPFFMDMFDKWEKRRVIPDEFEFRIRKQNHEVLWMGIHPQVIEEVKNNISCENESILLIVAEDITEKKNTQQKILNAKIIAERENKLKTEFMDYVAHELRNPFGHILNYAEFGISKIEVVDRKKLLKYFTQIHKSTTRLLNILNELLDLSKLDAGKMKFKMEKIDVINVINEAVFEIKPTLEAKELSFMMDINSTPSVIICDGFRLGQVIRNLFSNAIKFSPQGKKIGVTFSETSIIGQRKTDRAIHAMQISILDEGHGIPENQLEHIFNKFAQSSKTKTGEGTGLGLPICKEILHAHQGKIWAENNKENGSIFHMVLPYEQETNIAERG